VHNIPVNTRNSGLIALIVAKVVFKKIGRKMRVVTFEILDLKCCVVWPVIFPEKVNIT